VQEKASARPEFIEHEGTIEVAGGDWLLVFDKSLATFTRWRVGEDELILRGPIPDFWRAPIDNDRGAGLQAGGVIDQAESRKSLYSSSSWESALDAVADGAVKSAVIDAEGAVHIDVERTAWDGAVKVNIQFIIHRSGRLEVGYTYQTDEELPLIPRIGMQWLLPPEMTQLSWYGRGPDPTYSDRAFEPMGVFEKAVMENWIHYSKPQENGNKVDLRWMRVLNESGVGLQILAPSPEAPLSCNALPYTSSQIQSEDYDWQLPAPTQIVLNIDHAQLGIGGDNSWGMICLPPYQLKEKEYHYRHYIEPVRPGE
jgi:beta-galactosidase